MEPANFTELKDKIFKETSIKCEVHKVSLVKARHAKSFCPICALAKVQEDEKKMLDRLTEKAYSKNKRWLRERSIISNEEMLNMTFENYLEVDEETKANKEKALKIARGYFKGRKGNAIFTGDFGTGKTHLAMAILNEINEHVNKKMAFVAMDELMRRIKSSFGDKSSLFQEDIIVNELIGVDILVLDDIGAEIGSVNKKSQANDYTVQVLNGILNGRTSKPTIFTTNLSKKDIIRIYDGRIESRMMRGITSESAVQFTETPDKRSKIDF